MLNKPKKAIMSKFCIYYNKPEGCKHDDGKCKFKHPTEDCRYAANNGKCDKGFKCTYDHWISDDNNPSCNNDLVLVTKELKQSRRQTDEITSLRKQLEALKMQNASMARHQQPMMAQRPSPPVMYHQQPMMAQRQFPPVMTQPQHVIVYQPILPHSDAVRFCNQINTIDKKTGKRGCPRGATCKFKHGTKTCEKYPSCDKGDRCPFQHIDKPVLST